ncbi:hypothetical protein L596_016641 [Steinernema carpocapsae]|uniref:Uncharacterized protein n=1 Tax=Steinernema carpocapsae TaxID=34508 RepID=A0A4U5NJB5_STECR|nr:hypothetical protein L596_016641 [Steinernema carpocapsae]
MDRQYYEDLAAYVLQTNPPEVIKASKRETAKAKNKFLKAIFMELKAGRNVIIDLEALKILKQSVRKCKKRKKGKKSKKSKH